MLRKETNSYNLLYKLNAWSDFGGKTPQSLAARAISSF